MKKWIKIAGLLLLSFPFAAQAEDFRYTTSNETITITKYIGTNITVIIPDTINGLPVISIGKRAFEGRVNLTSVIIGTNVTCIGDLAFAFRNLTSVTIPNSVTSIGMGAFIYCTSLTGVTIPNSVTNIGERAFQDCRSLNTITVDDLNAVYSSTNGVLFDKNQATLIQCPGGKDGSYTIPDSVTRIGERAFLGCTSLTSVTIPNSVTNIGTRAFLDCKNLNTITVDDRNSAYSSTNGVLFDKNQTTLIQCPGGKAGSFSIPNGVTRIGYRAFADCPSLTSVTIPNSVTSIEELAFYCSNLTGVTIPHSVTNIGPSAFEVGRSLNTITVDDRNSAYSSTNGVLFNKSQTTLIQCLQGEAGSYAIPNSVTRIEDRAFIYCDSLTGITIPSDVTHIGEFAFFRCSKLTSVTIPNSVTYIGGQVFSACDKLNAIAVDDLNPVYSSADGVLYDKNQTVLIRCPERKAGSYAIPNSVTRIGEWAFRSCDSLTSITIPNSVTCIEECAFYFCTNLTSITIPNSVTNIGNRAFGFCTNLTEVYFRGNAPDLDMEDVFRDDDKAIIYRTAGATGWPPVPEPWAGRPTALWDPSANKNSVSWKQRFFGGLTNYWPISLL